MINLASIVRCPRCKSNILESQPPSRQSEAAERRIYCSNARCDYASRGFTFADGRPVLIDFDASIFDADAYSYGGSKSVLPRNDTGTGIRTILRRAIIGRNYKAREFCSEMLRILKRNSDRPKLLIVGGGAIGEGTNEFYADPELDLVSIDVYSSQNVTIVADAHQLPFADSVFDGLWIQSVLEHVLNPEIVVQEIHRVLNQNGLVFADAPFMWPVHEGAYDFTRFSLNGFRWLFRNFELISAGVGSGAGTATLLSIRYLIRSLTGSNVFSTLASAPFFWLRYLDRYTQSRPNADAASGIYFFGARSAQSIPTKSMITFYEKQAIHRDIT